MDFDALYARYADSCDGWEYERGIRSVSTDDLSARLTDWLEGLVEDGESLDDQDDVRASRLMKSSSSSMHTANASFFVVFNPISK